MSEQTVNVPAATAALTQHNTDYRLGFTSAQISGFVNAVATAVTARTPAPQTAVAQYAQSQGISLGTDASGDQATYIANLIVSA